jgi:hypothetical protein
MPDISPLDQVKQDFVQHVTGDHLFASVYNDLQQVKKADGGNLADDKVAAKFQTDLVDINKTVKQYLPELSISAIDDSGHIVFSNASGDKLTIDASKAVTIADGAIKTEAVNQGQKSQITSDSAGYATDIKYPAGADGKQHETKFAYDDTAGFHRLTKISKDDGTTYELITDDKSADKGKWKVTDAAGKSTVEDLKIGINPGGDWCRTEGGKIIWEKADGSKDAKSPDDKNQASDKQAKEAAVKKQMLEDATQRKGEGPYQTAERLLPGASYAETIALAHVLKKYFQVHNNDSSDKLVKLKLGNHWLTEDNLQEIMDKSPTLKARYAKLQES